MKRIRITDYILKILIWGFSFISVGILACILGYVLYKGLPYLIMNLNFLTDKYKPGLDMFGIFPMIMTTLYIIGITLIIAAPIGICSAIYLVEYSKPGIVLRLIRFSTESLAGIPSIIYGLFGYIFFVTALHLKFSILAGALTLSIMVLPTIIRTTEEALKTVPVSFREGSLALGATKLTTITRIILPSAIPGILTAVILTIGRIIGESAAVYFTAGWVAQTPHLMHSGRTLSVHLFYLVKEGLSMDQSFATASVLIILVALINFIANRAASKLKKVTMGN